MSETIAGSSAMAAMAASRSSAPARSTGISTTRRLRAPHLRVALCSAVEMTVGRPGWAKVALWNASDVLSEPGGEHDGGGCGADQGGHRLRLAHRAGGFPARPWGGWIGTRPAEPGSTDHGF